jgi:hypothetical protein
MENRLSQVRGALRSLRSSIVRLGIVSAVLLFGPAGSSGGYDLVPSESGTDISRDGSVQYTVSMALQKQGKTPAEKGAVNQSDAESEERGKALFVGPGLKDILKNTRLPVSRMSATPENIKKQLLEPINRMPAFDYLSEDEITALISYLKTL